MFEFYPSSIDSDSSNQKVLDKNTMKEAIQTESLQNER